MTSTDPEPFVDARPAEPARRAWQPPPPRAVRLHVLTTAGLFAVVAIAALATPLMVAGDWAPSRMSGIAAGSVAIGALAGAWVGARLRHQRWRLDDDGLWLRTGRLWRRETQVPASRVQHVDLRRGPLERRARLATLVVHTAAVHVSGITVRGLDDQDAEALRDALARQLDDAGDAL